MSGGRDIEGCRRDDDWGGAVNRRGGIIGEGETIGRRIVGDGDASVSIRVQNLSKVRGRAPIDGLRSHSMEASPGREWSKWYILYRTWRPEEM